MFAFFLAMLLVAVVYMRAERSAKQAASAVGTPQAISLPPENVPDSPQTEEPGIFFANEGALEQTPGLSAAVGCELAELEPLEKKLNAMLSDVKGKWSVWLELPAGGSISCCSDTEPATPMVSASLIKLFIMAATYEKIESGAVMETESVKSDLNKMITVSDNEAANRLIILLGGGQSVRDSQQAGMQAVTAYAESIGCTSTSLNRLLLDYNGLQNYTSSADCAKLLGMIYKGTCVNEKRSAEMCDLLLHQEIRTKIPAGIEDEHTKIANKTGELSGIAQCDAAIVYAEEQDYILCIMAENPDGDAQAATLIKDISKTVFTFFMESKDE